MHAALALAQELAHPFSLGRVLHGLAYLHALRQEVDAVREQAAAIMALATAQGFPLWSAAGTFWHGLVLAMQGHSEAGIRQMRQGMAAWDATGTQWPSPVYLAWLAEALGHDGQVDEGLRLLAEALAVVDTTGECWWEAELHRLTGDLLLRQAVPAAPQAETCWHQALAVARRQHARSWELRAAMSLSRLWQQQGKRDDAYALLAPIYGWFTEGFDTADLQEARRLLEELA
jgi:predicted ATPase